MPVIPIYTNHPHDAGFTTRRYSHSLGWAKTGKEKLPSISTSGMHPQAIVLWTVQVMLPFLDCARVVFS
jgi:hypothetical protein